MFQQFKTATNPQEVILQNPQLQEAIQYMKAFQSPEQAIASLANQRGLTLQDLKDIFS